MQVRQLVLLLTGVVGLCRGTPEDLCQLGGLVVTTARGQPLLSPLNCGTTVNASLLAAPPHVNYTGYIAHPSDKFVLMLLESENFFPHSDSFFVHWLLANITPLNGSMTLNQTRTEVASYIAPVNVTSTYHLLVLPQLKGIISPYSLSANLTRKGFSLQRWSSAYLLGHPLGGLRFFLKATTSVRPGYVQNGQRPAPPHPLPPVGGGSPVRPPLPPGPVPFSSIRPFLYVNDTSFSLVSGVNPYPAGTLLSINRTMYTSPVQLPKLLSTGVIKIDNSVLCADWSGHRRSSQVYLVNGTRYTNVCFVKSGSTQLFPSLLLTLLLLTYPVLFSS